MRNLPFLLRTAFLAVALATSLAAAVPPAVPAAVFDVEAVSPAAKDRAAQFSALLFAGLSNQPGLALVERAQLDVVLGEVALGASGLAEVGSAAKVGKLTGAKVLITARAIGSGAELTFVAKVTGTETGRVFAATKVLAAGESAAEAAEALAAQIAGIVATRAGELLAPVENPGERETRLKALVAGRRLPSVTVVIPEQHLTRPVRDPAAETEIARTYGALGGEILDAGAADRAAVRITGEAMSELGTRRGDFVSCRARVEIKVVEVATGKVLLQDRQTEVAADLAESIAAKNALQAAGAKLAERIVEALAANAR